MDIKKLIKNFNKPLISILFIVFLTYLYRYSLFPSFFYDEELCLNENNSLGGCFSNYVKYQVYSLKGDCYITKFDEKGVSNETHNLLVDIYVLDSNFTDGKIIKVVDEVSSIYEDYGVRFYVNNITRIENYDFTSVSLAKLNEIESFAKNVVKDKLYLSEDNLLDIIFIEKFGFVVADIELEGKSWNAFGNGSVNLVLVSTKSKNISWLLAHELGHLFRNSDKAFFSGEYNLMTHGSCIKSTVLNQKQVDSVISNVKQLGHRNNSEN